MKLKEKKQIILFAASILLIAVMAVIFVQTRKAGIQKQKEESVTDQSAVTVAPEDETADNTKGDGTRIITVYSVDRELREILNQYAKEHWDFPYTINFYADDIVYSSTDIINISSDMLVNDPTALDMYIVPINASYFIKGELSEYASTYRELGIDIDADLKKADIPQYAIDYGTNAEGEIVALPYLSTVSVFAYRRSVAKEVWGTDDPNEINRILGGGTENWEAFKQAALTLKEHGYYIVPGFKDIFWPGLSGARGSDGEINPKWDEYMEVSKYLYDNGCIKDTETWTEQWYKDLEGKGDKIFGYVSFTDYFQYMNAGDTSGDWAICMTPCITVGDSYTGPLVNKNSPNKDILGPFIEWLTLDGSENGLQYQLSTGTFQQDLKLSVMSGAVLQSADSSREFLGGQNINPLVYEELSKVSNMNGLTDNMNNNNVYYWEEAIKAYLWGGKDKDTAIKEFNAATATGELPGPDPNQDKVITWKNKNFERAIRNELKKPTSDIYLSDVSKITELNLEGKNLDSLEGIEYFTNLTKLYCGINQIRDISQLFNLTKLEVLFLNENKISDISGIENLQSLTELNLSANEIVDIHSLAGLTNLKALYLLSNQINDISSLAGLTNLEDLELYQNQISNIDSLQNLTKLKVLTLFDNKITDISALKELVNLEQLYLDYNKISDISSLAGLSNLDSLSLANNEISDINSLSKLTKLNFLTLNDNNITDIGSLGSLQNLTNLEIKSNEIADISNFAGLKKLVHLDLSDNEISDISKLVEFTGLDSLFLANNKITDISVIGKMPNLKSLSLVGNDIKDKTPAKDVLYNNW
jgi:Leucine-rich repeat (LRR) protein